MATSRPALRYLHLEDSQATASSVSNWLGRALPGCKGRRAATRDEFMAALQADDFDVILSDYELAAMDSVTALELAQLQNPPKPFIFLAGDIGEEQVVELMRLGASDFVHKDRLQRLAPAMERAIKEAASGSNHPLRDLVLKRAEARIREQAALLDKAQDAILVQNLDGVITYWNKGAEQIYGWASSEAVGRDAAVLLAMDEVRHRFARSHALAHGEWRGECTHRTKSGAEVVVQSRWSLVQDADGEPKAFLVINTDMTENRQLEAKFLRAQRLESMGMLVGGIAHDLNNVLAPILMSVDLLRTMMRDPEADRLIQTMQRSVKHGSALVQQLLAFARGAEGRHVEVNLRPLLSEFVDFMKPTVGAKIHIELDFLESPAPVLADATQLKQVLMNLCINARDAMPRGGRIGMTVTNLKLDEARARLVPEGRPGDYVVLTVQDDGGGIPPQILERIFDPFFTTKEPGKGTGLGLSTVRGIVKGHGGFMTVESVVNEGTVFRIYLPVHTSGEARAGDKPPAILLVEDEEMVRNTLTLLLKSEGYHVLPAVDAREALALFDDPANHVTLLIADLGLPGMDGCELIAAVRKKQPGLPAIAMTGMPSGEITGMEEFPDVSLLNKPMTRIMLMRAVEQAVKPAV
ncbi:MAG: response regulator [Cephaloticoccus sp.]|nr:response regulator [Cephaloticoccus sp.]